MRRPDLLRAHDTPARRGRMQRHWNDFLSASGDAHPKIAEVFFAGYRAAERDLAERGAKKGGCARMAKLSPQERKELARLGGKARAQHAAEFEAKAG